MKQVAEDYTMIFTDLLTHMQKEEVILFPRIADLPSQNGSHWAQAYLSGPIAVMEAEHQEAGQYMQRVKELTNNFTPPETACTTHRVSLLELKAFEENLHQHVHLENNILFTRVLTL
jgi:regulator of cell morphogenesis and NO signaling